MCFSNPLVLGTKKLCSLLNMKEIHVQDHPDPLKLQQKTVEKNFDVGHKQLCCRQESKVTTGYYFCFYSDNSVVEVTFLHFP